MTGDSPRSTDVAVVIVNWNTKALLNECLLSFSRYPAPGVRTGLVVVDNGSSDGSAEFVRREWPRVQLIANPDNRGFTRASNQGIQATAGEYVLLINTDAELTDGCLDLLVSEMEKDPRLAAASPRLMSPSGRWQRTVAGQAPTLRSAINHYLFLERVIPGSFTGLYLTRDTARSRHVDWISSACMLLRRSALDQVGLLDERFFMYMDDVDICGRLRAAGWSVAYVPTAGAIHHEGGSSVNADAAVKLGALQNFQRYFEREHGSRQLALLRLVQVLGFGARAIMFAARAMLTRESRLKVRASQNLAYMRFAGGSGSVPVRPVDTITKHRKERS